MAAQALSSLALTHFVMTLNFLSARTQGLSRSGYLLLLAFAGAIACCGSAAAQTIWSDGIVKPYRSVIISSSLRETIRGIDIEEGARVKKGQLLIHLESEKQRLAVERYSLVIEKADFDHKAAQRLFELNVSSRDDALDKELELKRLIVEKAIAQVEYDERIIKSPLDGVVVRKFKEAGEAVNEVEPILQVIENDRLLLLFYLHADMLSSVVIGEGVVTRYPALSNVEKVAKIQFIDPEVDARSGLFRLRLLLDNKDESIKPGMRVQAVFSTVGNQADAASALSSTEQF